MEIRYQLPLALGTANEIDKECTICQIRYGIGDHIVTLPCQHFFQYVDDERIFIIFVRVM